MSTQTKDSLNKSATIIFFEKFNKGNIYIKNDLVSFSMGCRNNRKQHLGHHTRDTHTRHSTFSRIVFVKNKTKRIKKKLDKPISPKCFHFFPATSPQSIFVILYIARWKNKENPNIRKNPKILCSKIYLNSLLLSKTRKCINVFNQMKIKREKSNDQIQVIYKL